MSPFFVSVILPVYNGQAFIADAIESILNQNFPTLELIVIDDGSTDRTAAIVSRYQTRLRYLYQPNQGPAAARNLGLQSMNGNIVGFIDADDLWPNGRLLKQLNFLEKNPDQLIVQGQLQYLCQSTDSPGWQACGQPFFSLSIASALFRKTAFEQIGFFDTNLRYCDDTDWLIRAQEQNLAITSRAEITLFYRRHEHNLTNQLEPFKHYTLQVLKKSLERKRRANEL